MSRPEALNLRTAGAAIGLGGGLLGGLLLSRALTRLGMAATPWVLVRAWSDPDFERYVAAVAPFVIATPLIAVAVEKGLLKTVPRTDQPRDAMIRLHLLLGLALAALVAAWGVSSSIASAQPSLTGAAALAAITVAVMQLTTASGRAAGRPRVEIVAQLCLAGVTVTLLAATLGGRLGPWGFLVALGVGAGSIATVIVIGVLSTTRPWLPSRAPALAAVRQVGLQGIGDVLAGVAAMALLLLTGQVGSSRERSLLYLALSSATVISAGYTYLLRLAQPAIVHLPGRSLVPRLDRWRPGPLAGSLTVGYLAAVAGLGHLGADRAGDPVDPLVTVAVLVALLPIMAVSAMLNFAYENSTQADLYRTVAAAGAALVVTLVAAVPLIAWTGAVGALTALALGELAHLSLLRPEPRERSAQ